MDLPSEWIQQRKGENLNTVNGIIKTVFKKKNE